MENEVNYQCRVCGRIWKESETHRDPRRPHTKTCGNYFCDGTCDPLWTKADPSQTDNDEAATLDPSRP